MLFCIKNVTFLKYSYEIKFKILKINHAEIFKNLCYFVLQM